MRRLPLIGDEVLLAVPGREQVAAQVTGMRPNQLELDLLAATRMPLSQLERVALFIEFINDEGIARMHGRVTRAETDGWTHSSIVNFAHRGAIQLLQRREYVRATTAMAMIVLPHGRLDHVARRVQAVDISGGGMLVRGLPAPRAGELYGFDLDLVPGQMPVSGQFRVVRVEPGDRAGVQFTAIDHRDRQRVIQRAYELSRHQRRRVA
jgi:c-di-GMP-binding flagellar brake protein YcgR